MSFLIRSKKADLLKLADELSLVVPPGSKILELKDMICESPNFEEELVKELLQNIVSERKEQEEREKQREHLELEQKRLESEQEERRLQSEREERRLEREYQLRTLELTANQNAAENSRVNQNSRAPEDELIKYLNLIKEQLPRAPNKTENWVFFFHQAETIFEIYNVPEQFRGKIILYRLSDLIRSLTNNLGIENLSDYKCIKECILEENRLTPLQYRKNFENCNKMFNENYIHWAAKVKTNLDYYLESREVSTFQDLKDLIVSDKMKDGLPPPVKSHILVKEGNNWFKPNELANEIEIYLESQPKSSWEKEATDSREKFRKPWAGNDSRNRDRGPEGTVNKGNNGNGNSNNGIKERKLSITCFECGNFGHYRTECLKFKEKIEGEKHINRVWISTGKPPSEITKGIIGEDSLNTIEVNIGGRKVEAIRDSGAQVSVFNKELIPERLRAVGTMELVPAVGRKQKAELINLPIALWKDPPKVSPRIKIVAAVTPNLNCPALITPTVYDALINQANSHQASGNFGKKKRSRKSDKKGVFLVSSGAVSEISSRETCKPQMEQEKRTQKGVSTERPVERGQEPKEGKPTATAQTKAHCSRSRGRYHSEGNRKGPEFLKGSRREQKGCSIVTKPEKENNFGTNSEQKWKYSNKPHHEKELRHVLKSFENFFTEEGKQAKLRSQVKFGEKVRLFQKLKWLLCETVDLNTSDSKKQFAISCKVSARMVEATLHQVDEAGKCVPITFASQKLNEMQKRWSCMEKEAYALMWALGKFKAWVFGNMIYVCTDHNIRKYLTERAPRNDKLKRWLSVLQRYNVVFNDKPDVNNQNADALSRLSTASKINENV